MYVKLLFLLVSAALVAGQRPSFAGTQPIGFPALTDAKPSDPFGNRFGEDLELPIEAKGDRDLVERLSKLPVDKQPFWYINWKALEAQRKNPQTYPQKPNVFNNAGSSANAQNSGNPQNSGNAQNSSNAQNGLTSKFGESSSGPTQNTQTQINQNQNSNQNYHNNYRNSRRHY